MGLAGLDWSAAALAELPLPELALFAALSELAPLEPSAPRLVATCWLGGGSVRPGAAIVAIAAGEKLPLRALRLP